MRFRLQTSSPLPLVKAWIAFPSIGHETIYALKAHICTTLQPLQHAHVQPEQIKFELDGFELLDDTPVTELLHENDLLVAIRRAEVTAPASSKSKKRKIEDVVEPTVLRSVSKKRKLPSPSTSSESSDSSDSDSSSSASSSDLDSSSDSDSDSDSDSSSSSSAPSERPVKKSKAQRNVPPGQGTTRTRSRNLRRRVARRSSANPAAIVPPLKSTSEANAVPLGTTPLPSNPLSLSMFSLGNKNKKKGFKQALRPPSSQKIVFSESEAPTPLLTPPVEPTSAPSTVPSSRYVYTFPSDLQTQGRLPSNVFVTSVDVEEGMWPQKNKKKKAKKQQIVEEPEYYPAEEEEIELQYDEEPQPLPDPNADLWASAQATFDALPLVTGVEQLAVGAIVGWKALALSPITFSPEIMLHLSAVQAIDQADNQIVTKPLPRPEAGTSEEEDLEPVELETTDLSMVRDLGWRVVA